MTAVGLRRLLLATVLTAAAVLGSSAFGHFPVARAEWDIEAFDACMKNMQSASPAAKEAYCCVWSGGDYHDGKCWAPPMNATGPNPSTSSRPLPPGAVNPAPPRNNPGGG